MEMGPYVFVADGLVNKYLLSRFCVLMKSFVEQMLPVNVHHIDPRKYSKGKVISPN